MNRLLVFSILLVLPLFAVLADSEQKSRRRANRPPSIASFTSSVSMIEICPFVSPVSSYAQPKVTLVVNATDPDGDSLRYEYSSTEGTISGEGKSVVWDLEGLPRGLHEMHVTVSDGKGGKAKGALTVRTVDAGICDPPPPPCPVIKVSCSDELDQARPFIFSAIMEREAESATLPSFNWKINAGRIVKGQHSRVIEVSTRGANGFDSITATVDVGGYDPSCAGMTVACTTKILR